MMKKAFASILVASIALFSFAQCEKPGQDTPDPGTEQPENPEQKPEKPVAGDYTLLLPDLTGFPKSAWEAGDQIYFHGNYAPNAKVITLKEGDISDGGKKATVHLDESLMEFLCAPDGIYAAYPAQAVIPGDSLMDSDSEYTEWNQVLLQAYLDKDHFSFRNLTAMMKFTVSGGYDSYALASVERDGMRVTGYKADITSEKESISSSTTDGYPFLYGTPVSDGSAANCIFLPGGKKFKKGFTIYFGKDGVYDKVYTVDQAKTLQPGELLDLGDISASLADYSGPAPKVPEKGKMTRYSVKFNELSGLCVDSSAEFLWILGDGGEIGQLSITGELLNSVGLRTTSGSTLDSEGISLNYDTGDLLISCEPNAFCRIPYESIPHIFDSKPFKGVVAQFSIADAKNFGNAGAEGCTYYKDGLVYIGTQTGSYLYLCNLETGEVLWRKGLRQMHPAITEIAGLSYDPLTDWLWIVDSESHKFFALTGDAEQLLAAYPLNTRSNEESICVDHKNSCVWVGDDYGSTSYVFKYEFTGLDDAIISQ